MTSQTLDNPQTRSHSESHPGSEQDMDRKPQYTPLVKGSGRLAGKVAIITGGDSGIGRGVAEAFASEGADVAILFYDETEDAQETKQAIEGYGKRCLTVAGDVGDPEFCHSAVQSVIETFGKLDILVNNAAEQTPQDDPLKISTDQLERTFRTNIYGYFFMTQAALPYLKSGAAIVNTASVVAFKGSPQLLDYSATKGAIVAFTRSLSQTLIEKGIRVNMVAPGPIWTPLITSTFPKEKQETFGQDTPMKRPGQPNEVASAFVFLASPESAYIAGQTLHVNGGEIVNA